MFPFLWSRRLHILLKQEWIEIGRHKIRSYMKILWIQALYPHKKTSIPNKAHKKYPYLLKDREITHSNQVWSTDITYIRMKRWFIYLIAIIDWYSRRILSWRVSNTLDVNFCTEALEEAIEKYGTPEIFNTDQWSQFTSHVFTSILEKIIFRLVWMGNEDMQIIFLLTDYGELLNKRKCIWENIILRWSDDFSQKIYDIL